MDAPRAPDRAWGSDTPPRSATGFAYAALAELLATAVGYVWTVLLKHGNLTLILILGVLVAGYRFGLRPALLAALLAFLSYNFFFEEPRFTLSINAEDLLAFCIFFAWKSWTLAHEAFVDGQASNSIWGPPLAIPYGMMASGMTLLCVQMLAQILSGLRGRHAS